MTITLVLLAGGLVGLGLFLCVRELFPAPPQLAAALDRFAPPTRRLSANTVPDGRAARIGRWLAARLAGTALDVRIPRRDLALIFTITGALSGLAGVMWASRYPTINPGSVGQGFELIVISAVIIGGTSVFGGAGSVLGVVLGCVLIGTINIALPALGISGFYQLAIYGLAILVAAVIDHFTQSRQRKGGHA